MKLNLTKRKGERKSELRQIRHQGDIPAIIYDPKGEGKKIVVSGVEFSAGMRQIKKGHLSTTVFELHLEGKTKKAFVKDIQYHPTTYVIRHLDFQYLEDKVLMDIKVPIVCLGESDCIGIKLGGFLRYIKRHIKVRCFPADIPSEFSIDIRNMNIGDVKRIRDVSLGEAVRPLGKQEEIIIVIAKR